jgi:hypothetical protein
MERPILVVRSICGDGILATDEECDNGSENDDMVYGGCTRSCKRGDFCGDGMVNGPEQCDWGPPRKDTHAYGDALGCTSACQVEPFCGDGIVDVAFDEQCDFGADNGTPRSHCDAACRVVVF